MTTAKLKKTLATIGNPAKKIFSAFKSIMTETKRVNTVKADVKVCAIHENTVYDCEDEKSALINQLVGVTQNLIVKKRSKEFLDNLTDALKEYCLVEDDLENALNIKVHIEDEGTATIAEIAEMYDFDAEQTMALYIGLELIDEGEISASDLIYAIDSRDFDFYPCATDYDEFGRELFDRSQVFSKRCDVLSWIIDTLDFEELGRNCARDSNVVVGDYGAVEIF